MKIVKRYKESWMVKIPLIAILIVLSITSALFLSKISSAQRSSISSKVSPRALQKPEIKLSGFTSKLEKMRKLDQAATAQIMKVFSMQLKYNATLNKKIVEKVNADKKLTTFSPIKNLQKLKIPFFSFFLVHVFCISVNPCLEPFAFGLLLLFPNGWDYLC